MLTRLEVIMMSLIRKVLGQLILFFDFVFAPRSKKRDERTQVLVDAQMVGLSLYQFKACPFCVKVRRAMKRQGVSMAVHDVKADARAHEALLAGGGRVKVPCLRIEEAGEVTWLYESSEIIRYIDNRVGSVSGELENA